MGQASLFYIFLTFLKLGATAFGGYMSLIAIVQKQLVEVDKKLKEEDLLDGISLTSVLPGPVAVNTIAYVGYRLRGIPGAIMAFAGIIIPSFLLVILLSWLYFSYGNIPAVKNVFSGITPAIMALIVTVAIGMTRKTVKLTMQWIICLLAALLLIFIGGFTVTFLLLVCSGIAGAFLFRQPGKKDVLPDGKALINRKQLVVSGIVLLLLLCTLLWGGQIPEAPKDIQILSTFSGISLTLFGGGYVVIPALHELFVENLKWLTSAEFADGIAIGQITPGPIFITATFIGYKVAGVLGAFLATFAIFTPPAILTVLLSRFVEVLNHSSVVKAAMKGIRAAVIGMIFASAITIGQTITLSVGAVAIFIITFIISFKYTISPIYLILGAGVAGFILF
ncbi:chromate efflux transporter [uncultured Parabacteroides sp.]|uniref:chromate efflux transporter n=1 Tax=uncultured Parabacteroides sp. TaxID=512312 RepID=UPI0025D81412|nr:chromate efflux transporter [uncultured Parabacteroides sp.]